MQTKSTAEKVLDYALSVADDGSIEGVIKFKDDFSADLRMTFPDDQRAYRIRIEPVE